MRTINKDFIIGFLLGIIALLSINAVSIDTSPVTYSIAGSEYGAWIINSKGHIWRVDGFMNPISARTKIIDSGNLPNQ
jgi:hypothetical protein